MASHYGENGSYLIWNKNIVDCFIFIGLHQLTIRIEVGEEV